MSGSYMGPLVLFCFSPSCPDLESLCTRQWKLSDESQGNEDIGLCFAPTYGELFLALYFLPLLSIIVQEEVSTHRAARTSPALDTPSHLQRSSTIFPLRRQVLWCPWETTELTKGSGEICFISFILWLLYALSWKTKLITEFWWTEMSGALSWNARFLATESNIMCKITPDVSILDLE